MKQLLPRPRSITLYTAALALACAVASTVARANAPPCRYTVSGATAKDTVTQLTWQRQGMGTYDWQGAQTACAALTLGSPAGTWRLPSAAEVQTIVDETQTALGPLIDKAVFTDNVVAPFWTATPRKNDVSQAWILAPITGQVVAHPVTEMNYVRCVH